MSKPAWATIIEQLMEDAGISQRSLSMRAGVGRTSLRRLLAGEDPNLSLLEKVLDVFEYDIDAIPRPLPEFAINCKISGGGDAQ